MIKHRLVHGLYLLQGSMVIGTTSVSSLFDFDTICLCHLSEARMLVLSKYGLLSDRKFVMLDSCKH